MHAHQRKGRIGCGMLLHVSYVTAESPDPRLRVPVRPTYRRLRNPEGSYGRLKILRRLVTALVRDERIERSWHQLDETRGYAERLIQDAVRLGDADPHTMDMANFWLEEKQLIHKLFKVLVPRYAEYNTSYTSLYRLPPGYKDKDNGIPKGVLELKENPFPSLRPDSHNNKNLLHNVLLEEARRQYRRNKYQQMAAEMARQAETSIGDTVEPSSTSPTLESTAVAGRDSTDSGSMTNGPRRQR